MASRLLLCFVFSASISASPTFDRRTPNNIVPIANGGSWEKGFQKAKALVAKLTNEEKAGIVTGQVGRCACNSLKVSRLGLPSICYQDGPQGVRPATGQSQFPSEHTLAATWDRDLFYAKSLAMGQEFFDMGVHVPLAPVAVGPLGRSPLEGRQFEAPGPDPYLSGEFVYQAVRGIQDAGVAGCLKHAIAYEQETSRNLYGAGVMINGQPQMPIDSYVDDRATHELYLWPAADAVRAGVFLTMCSYNMINGTHACHSPELMADLLKTELNFQGAASCILRINTNRGQIISDWGAEWNNEDTIKNGMDISAPGLGYFNSLGSFGGQNWTDLVNNGTIAESRLDDMVIRSLTSYFQLGMDEKPLPSVPFNAVGYPGIETFYRDVQKSATVALIKKIGEDSAVLLKNEGGLPLNKPQRIAIIGADAGPNEAGWLACGAFGSECAPGNINGTLSLGTGSGYAFPHNLITPLAAISNRAAQDGSYVTESLNNTDLESIAISAANADVVLVFAEVYEGEGIDRANLNLTDNGDAMILAAAAQNNNTIVILHIPGPTILDGFIEHPNITAVLAPLYPGEQTGNSLVSLLYGDVSPSGKLPFTIGKSESDYIPNSIINEPDNFTPKSYFNESLKIDYRWFDSYNIEPRFEFGFGLSYTTFSYSNIKLDKTFKADDKAIQKTNERFAESTGNSSLYDVVATVTATVTNTGNVVACEVAQLYVAYPTAAGEPPVQLRGFDKVQQLKPGSAATVSFPLRRKDLSVWDTVKQLWRVPDGDFTLYVGSSSRKLPLKVKYP